MKKRLLAKCLVLLALGFAALASAAATKTVTWSLPADWESRLELDYPSEPAGAPSVPYYNALIEVPAGATSFVVTASDVAYCASDRARPAPVLEPSVVGEPRNAPVEDPALYASVFPSDVFEQGEPWDMDGKTFLPVRIKAYRWNGPKNTVEAIESLTLSIVCELPRSLKLTTSAVPTEKVDYIVVSPPNFVSYWQKFIDYRRATHPSMTFEIVNTDDIYAKYAGHDDALKIHHFIEDMYAKGTRYILLGAGAQHTSYDRNSMIMTRIVITKDSRTQGCDYYYCVVEKPSGAQEVWDYNGDQIYLASKNPKGGYYADAASQFSWTGAMKVHRFPARTTVSLGGKSKSAKEQIEGYVEKLKRYEQGLFQGRFSQAVLANTLTEEYNRYHGNTSAECTTERQFYDLGANIFSAEHGSVTALNEYETRERSPSYFTLHRPVGYNRSVLQRYYSNGETAADFYKRNFESMLINSHGSPEVVEPLNRNGVFGATGLCGFHFLIVPCHAGNPCAGSNTEVSISEAGVVNPDGGSLVAFGNSNTGLWGGKDVYSEKIERDVVKMLYRCQNGSFNDAGTSRLWAMNNYKWNGLTPNTWGGLLMCDSMAYGDPLVKLTDIWSRVVDADGTWHRGDQLTTPSEQEFASTLTVNAGSADNEITITNAIGAANLIVNGASGKTLTLAADANGKFKVSNTVTVNNGMTLNWDVPGGFARNGVNLANGGNLRLRAGGYYGIDFKGINKLTVAPPAGSTAIMDFDSKNYFRNGEGKFAELEVTGAGETIFRSRQAGIFSTDFSIPVSGGGKLTLEAPCVGGSSSQSADVPLFKVSGATLAVRPNPNWAAECFSRSVWLDDGIIVSSFDKFYFGPNGSGYPGLDVWIEGDGNQFAGTYPIRLNGQLRLHARNNGGTLNVATELANGNSAGSLSVEPGIILKLAKSNSFSGNITVPNGARLVVDNAGGLGTGNVVVEAGGTLQMNAMPLTGVKSVTLRSGAKLVLKSSGSGSYQMYSPATTSFAMPDGVKVYDSSDETKELNGIVTPEGAYFVSDEAKVWRGTPLTWSSTSTALAWEKKGVPTTYSDGDTVLFKSVSGQDSTTVYVSGEVKPGMMAFNNPTTEYVFDGADASVTVASMATVGKTLFEPAIRATSQLSVGGKTTVGNVTTPSLNVAGGGALQVKGTVSGIDVIGSIRFNANETCGIPSWNDKMSALQLSELQFFDAAGKMIVFPVDTVIKDSAGNTTKITAVTGSVYTFNNDNSITKLFDGKCNTYHTVGSSKQGPWSITINLGSPIEMFKSFKYGYGQNYYIEDIMARLYSGVDYYPYANPYGWQVSVGDSEASLKNVIARNAERDASWYSKLSNAFTPSSAASSSKATVQDGGMLYLNGTFNVPVNVHAGATLAVTNTSKATFGGGKTWPTEDYSMTVDTREAKKQASWFQVTQNAGFSSARLFRSDDDVAVKVQGGDLWVATAGVVEAPYLRVMTGTDLTFSWNSEDWLDGQTNWFEGTWSNVMTKPTGNATLEVAGTNLTLNVDCGVALDTLNVVTTAGCHPQTLTANAGYAGAMEASVLDFRNFCGRVTWNPLLASFGTDVYVGTNDVTIAAMTGGKGRLQVSAGGRATVPEKFASYDVDQDAFVRFKGTHNFAMSDIPTQGYLSFKNTTFTGGFQNALIKYIVEPGDALVFTGDGNNYNGRTSSSFDIRGGSVTINSNGASTWFGINGETRYTQTAGTFKCTANGTAMNVNNSGFLVGYSASMTEDFVFDISGGRFELPNTYINFYGPTRFNLTSNAVLQAKGVFKGANNKGVITVNAGTVFEIGSIGLVDGACDCNLYGGTLAAFEDATIAAPITIAGRGTLAAKAGTTLAIDGGLQSDGATLNIGAEGYAGTVRTATLPAGVTNVTISAGTWHLGALRPTGKTLGSSAGALSITLSNTQIHDARTTPVRIIRATQMPAGGVKVLSRRGVEQSNVVVAIDSAGYLTVKTTHDNDTETIAGVKWGNIGNAGHRISTKADQASFTGKTWTLNLTNTVNMCASEIGPTGMYTIKSMRFFGRKSNDKAKPTKVTLTQGANVIVSTSVKNTAAGGTLYVVGGTSQTYGLNEFTFEGTVALDPSKNITMTFEPSDKDLGYGMTQPANTLLYHAFSGGNFSPIVEFTGDYTYPTGEDDSGDSVSINVIGGNSGLAGKSIADGNAAGVVSVKGVNWNQGGARSDKSSVNDVMTGLKEVLADGTVAVGPMSVRMVAACGYAAKGSTPSGGDAELAYGYLDDGQTSGSYGATITVENIPYSSYDVYVYMGSDQTTTSGSFAPVTVVGGNKTEQYPTTKTGWGSATSARGTVTLSEKGNYLKFTGLSGSSLTVKGAKNGTVSNARCGIAGIQIVNTGVRTCALTWGGGASGEWNATAKTWRDAGDNAVAWTDTTAMSRVANFTNDTTVTLTENVSPTLINLETCTIAKHEGFVPTTATVLFENVDLSNVATVAGEMWGGYVDNDGPADVYYYKNDGSTLSCQFQKFNSPYAKCVKVVLTQDGANVKGVVAYAKYIQNGTIGTDFDSAGTGGPIAMSDTGNGYGIKRLALTTYDKGVLTVKGAQNFGGPLVVTNGTICVTAGEMMSDLTLAEGAAIDVAVDEKADVAVITTGAFTNLNGEAVNVFVNGVPVTPETWTLEGGTLRRVRIARPMIFLIGLTVPLPVFAR